MSSSRRDFLRTLSMAGVGAVLAPRGVQAGPSLHRYESYGWLRGFSVVPSWGARIEEAWALYDGARMREEVGLAREAHANCIRLWIDFAAWMGEPERVTERFLDAVGAIDEAGMKVMPCLFNRWHDSRYDYGGTSVENVLGKWEPQLEYVRALVTPLATDARVLIWDLCNEPQTGASWAKASESALGGREHDWLGAIAKTAREAGAQQPVTIGTMSGANIEACADLCDVLCGHPYAHDRAGLGKLLEGFEGLRQRTGKPFLVNECIPGSLDDLTRAEVARYYTEDLAKAGFGWMGWALKEGKAISTRRDRFDANGIKAEGFHPFFTKEGKLRGGLEFLREKPALTAPWQK